MTIQTGIWTAVAVALIGANSAFAQTGNPYALPQNSEFMESSSPLKGGGTITYRLVPGQQVQTIYTPPAPSLAALPVGVPGPTGAGLRETSTGPSAANNPMQVPPPAQYPYPATGPAAPAGSPQFYLPPAPLTAPTLGITPHSNWRSQRPAVSQQTFFGGNVYPGPAAATAPSLSTAPGQPSVAYPQPQSPSTVWPPLASPLPAAPAPPGMAPLVRLQNMPQGSYLGQGIVGQPKAYVDGQPLRNMFRYILP